MERQTPVDGADGASAQETAYYRLLEETGASEEELSAAAATVGAHLEMEARRRGGMRAEALEREAARRADASAADPAGTTGSDAGSGRTTLEAFVAANGWTCRIRDSSTTVELGDAVAALIAAVPEDGVPEAQFMWGTEGFDVVGNGFHAAIAAAAEGGALHHVSTDDGDEVWVVFADVVVGVQVAHDDARMTIVPYVLTDEACWDADACDMMDRSDDPSFGEDTPDDDFHVLHGEDTLDRVLLDIATTSDAFPKGACGIRVQSATDDECADIDYVEDFDDYEPSGVDTSARDATLFGIAIDRFQPSGVEWQYNDGLRDRRSGYYPSARYHDVEIDLGPASATMRAALRRKRDEEVFAARGRLVEWLRSAGAPEATVATEVATLETERAALAAKAESKRSGRRRASGHGTTA